MCLDTLHVVMRGVSAVSLSRASSKTNAQNWRGLFLYAPYRDVPKARHITRVNTCNTCLDPTLICSRTMQYQRGTHPQLHQTTFRPWATDAVRACVCVMQEGAKDRDHVHMEGNTPWLELLLGISGAFRPKVLTCLMGVTGAGKTTLMDVLAGRKTGMGRLGFTAFTAVRVAHHRHP